MPGNRFEYSLDELVEVWNKSNNSSHDPKDPAHPGEPKKNFEARVEFDDPPPPPPPPDPNNEPIGKVAQIDQGTFLVYNHAITNTIVGAVNVIKVSATQYDEYILIHQSYTTAYPFAPAATLGTVRFRQLSATPYAATNIAQFVTDMGTNHGFNGNAIRRSLTYDPSANPLNF